MGSMTSPRSSNRDFPVGPIESTMPSLARFSCESSVTINAFSNKPLSGVNLSSSMSSPRSHCHNFLTSTINFHRWAPIVKISNELNIISTSRASALNISMIQAQVQDWTYHWVGEANSNHNSSSTRLAYITTLNSLTMLSTLLNCSLHH